MPVTQKEVLLTPEGFRKLEEEIEHLSTTRRDEVAERIKQAREFGDISENSEYDDAKYEQALLESKIEQLGDRLSRARVIEVSDNSTETVVLGAAIKVKDLDYDEMFVYRLVGSAEADPSNHLLSNESPLGQTLLGKNKGEVVEVPAPAGTVRYEIVDVGADVDAGVAAESSE